MADPETEYRLKSLENRLDAATRVNRSSDDWMHKHLGVDWGQATEGNPHPNQKVRNFYFGTVAGEPTGRLSPDGLTFLGTTGGEFIAWVNSLDDPVRTAPYVELQANTTSPYLALNVQRATSNLSQAYLTNTTDGATLGWFLYHTDVTVVPAGLFPAVAIAADNLNDYKFYIRDLPLLLAGMTADFTTALEDGMLWYRTDTDKFRARVNGSTVNLLTSADSVAANIQPYVAKTANYTTTNADGVISCDTTAGAFTITLVTAVGNAGLRHTIKKTASAGNDLTIGRNGSETIDGKSTDWILRALNDSITLISNGANWLVERPMRQVYKAVTGTYTSVSSDQVIDADATSGSFTITLETAASTGAGYMKTIKKTTAANVVTIDANGSQTIDGRLTIGLTAINSFVTIVSDGANWMIVNRSIVQDAVTADTTVSNSATETTIYTYSVPANTLGTNGHLRLTLLATLLNNSGANRTYTFRGKFGGTTLIDDAAIALPASAAARTLKITLDLYGDGATNAQVMAMTIEASAVLGVTSGLGGDYGTAGTMPPSTIIGNLSTFDQTGAGTLLVSVQSDANTATQTLVTRISNLENIS